MNKETDCCLPIDCGQSHFEIRMKKKTNLCPTLLQWIKWHYTEQKYDDTLRQDTRRRQFRKQKETKQIQSVGKGKYSQIKREFATEKKEQRTLNGKRGTVILLGFFLNILLVQKQSHLPRPHSPTVVLSKMDPPSLEVNSYYPCFFFPLFLLLPRHCVFLIHFFFVCLFSLSLKSSTSKQTLLSLSFSSHLRSSAHLFFKSSNWCRFFGEVSCQSHCLSAPNCLSLSAENAS